MKFRIVFELEAHPDMRLVDVTAITQVAAMAFVRDTTLAGECKLVSIGRPSAHIIDAPASEGNKT